MSLSARETLFLRALDEEAPMKYSLDLGSMKEFPYSHAFFLELVRRGFFGEAEWNMLIHCKISIEWLWETESHWSVFPSAVQELCWRNSTTPEEFMRLSSLLTTEQAIEALLGRWWKDRHDEKWSGIWNQYAPFFTWRNWLSFLNENSQPSLFLQHYQPDGSLESCVLVATYLQYQVSDESLYEKHRLVFEQLRRLGEGALKIAREWECVSSTNYIKFYSILSALDQEKRDILCDILDESVDCAFTTLRYFLEDVANWQKSHDWYRSEEGEDYEDNTKVDTFTKELCDECINVLEMLGRCPPLFKIMHHVPFPEALKELQSSSKNLHFWAVREFIKTRALSVGQGWELFHLTSTDDDCKKFRSELLLHLSVGTLLMLMDEKPFEFSSYISPRPEEMENLSEELHERYRNYVSRTIGTNNMSPNISERYLPSEDVFRAMEPAMLLKCVRYNNFPRSEAFYRETQHVWSINYDVMSPGWNSIYKRKFLSVDYRRELALTLKETEPEAYQMAALNRNLSDLNLLPITTMRTYHRDFYVPDDEEFLIANFGFYLRTVGIVFEQESELDRALLDDKVAKDFVTKLSYGSRKKLATEVKLLNDETYYYYTLRYANFVPGELEELFLSSSPSPGTGEKLWCVCQRNLTDEQFSFVLDQLKNVKEKIRWSCYSQLMYHL